MAWCCLATSHYLSKCWPRSLSPYGVARRQWVNYIELRSDYTGVCYKNFGENCFIMRLVPHSFDNPPMQCPIQSWHCLNPNDSDYSPNTQCDLWLYSIHVQSVYLMHIATVNCYVTTGKMWPELIQCIMLMWWWWWWWMWCGGGVGGMVLVLVGYFTTNLSKMSFDFKFKS